MPLPRHKDKGFKQCLPVCQSLIKNIYIYLQMEKFI